MQSARVEVHAADPLHFLLIGPMPTITSSKTARVHRNQAEGADPDVDTSAFPAPITGYRKQRPATQRDRRRPERTEHYPLAKFRSVKTAEKVMDKAVDYMGTYADNHRRKAIHIHKDWEDRYMTPLESRMKRKLTGRPYSEFRDTRSRATTALEEKSGVRMTGLESGPVYNALTDEDSVTLPFVQIPTDGCDDRIHKYRKVTERESNLTQVVDESRGIVHEVPVLKERMTVDPVAWKVLPETRFYHQNAAVPPRKGRRPFSEILHSRIGQTLDQF
jgi:hypothetical protein